MKSWIANSTKSSKAGPKLFGRHNTIRLEIRTPEQVSVDSAGAGQAGGQQADINRAVYGSPRIYRHYLSKVLTPPETACLLKYQTHFAGRDILDIGVGAGRTTRYLAPLARSYEAVDYSPVMVGYLAATMPSISVHQADFRRMDMFPAASFDFVFATDNVIDALSHQHRLQALAELYRVLRPGGVAIVSSHNLCYRYAYSGPVVNWSPNPVRLAANCFNYAVSWKNHMRVRGLRATTPEYALINDQGHYYACLHYYTSRSVMTSQFRQAGLRMLEAFGADGTVVPDGQDDSAHPSLAYVVERMP